jgi:hypothetical protein
VLDPDFRWTDESVAKAAAFHRATLIDGLDMGDDATFFAKTWLATRLWPQAGGTKPYLLGKGAGVELALQGRVVGRTPRPVAFAIRTHSDFELYGVHADTSAPKAFFRVFGSPERYPPEKTKGLSSLPPDLLVSTGEEVDLGGAFRACVPQLELLFLDKFLVRESTPRPEGYDHELLARRYDLDGPLIHTYLDRYWLEPERRTLAAKQSLDRVAQQIGAIERRVQFLQSTWAEEHDDAPKAADLIHALNADMASRVPRASQMYGILMRAWVPLAGGDIDPATLRLTPEAQRRVSQPFDEIASAERAELEALAEAHHREIDSLLSLDAR